MRTWRLHRRRTLTRACGRRVLPLYSVERAKPHALYLQGELITLTAMAATLLSVLFGAALYIQLISAVYTPTDGDDGFVPPVRDARQTCLRTALH